MKELYNTNKDFREYVDKYCNKHHIKTDEALQHLMVKDYAHYILKKGDADKTLT